MKSLSREQLDTPTRTHRLLQLVLSARGLDIGFLSIFERRAAIPHYKGLNCTLIILHGDEFKGKNPTCRLFHSFMFRKHRRERCQRKRVSAICISVHIRVCMQRAEKKAYAIFFHEQDKSSKSCLRAYCNPLKCNLLRKGLFGALKTSFLQKHKAQRIICCRHCRRRNEKKERKEEKGEILGQQLMGLLTIRRYPTDLPTFRFLTGTRFYESSATSTIPPGGFFDQRETVTFYVCPNLVFVILPKLA